VLAWSHPLDSCGTSVSFSILSCWVAHKACQI